VAEYLRCKVCGYVSEARRVSGACPACGAARKAMEGWKDPAGPGRRAILSLSIHPIVDHFAVSFATSAFVLSLVALVIPGIATVMDLLRALAGILPIAVLAAFLTGLIDARARLRRSKGMVLRRKRIIGMVLFVFSAAAAVLLYAVDQGLPWVLGVVTVLLGACTVCCVLLGRIGTSLLTVIMPE
jgi:hypothetical protein